MAEKSTTKEALKKLDVQLECSLCLDTFKEPKLLPCFHVFCKSPCLEKLVVKDGQSLCCPTCRHIVPLSAKGVAGLQSDFHVDRLFEIRDAFDKAAETTETQCGSCEDGKATGYCRDCGDFLCDNCQAAHKQLRITKSHQLISLDEVQSQATNLIHSKKAVPHCPKHSNKKLKIYCETCKELICNDCTIRLHKDHNYDLVADVFPKHKIDIVSSLKPVKEKLDKIQGALIAFETRAKEINDQRATLEADIHREIDQQRRQLNQRRVELVGELDVLTQQKLKSLAAQRDQVEITQVKLTSCLEYAEGGLETGTEGEVLAMKAPVLKRIKQISTEFDPDTIQPETEADIRLLTDGKEQFQQTCHGFLEIITSESFSAENTHATGDGLIGAELYKTATVELHVRTKDNKSYDRRTNVNAEITRCKSSTRIKCTVKKEANKHMISYLSSKRGKHELHISVNGKKIRGSPFTLAVMPLPSTLRKPSKVIGYLNRPWGIATNSNGQKILAEFGSNRISIYSSEFEKIHMFGSQATGNGQFNGPSSITVDDDDNIYVSDCNNHRIQKFSSRGNFLLSVGTEGTANLQFNNPCAVGYNKTNEKVYVCDQYNHRVQVLNRDLTFNSHFDNNLQNPAGVCFDTYGNVYIADLNNHQIQVFTSDGAFLRKFGKKGSGPGELNQPLDVTISSTGVLYVTEMTGNRVSIFKVTGEFIRSFGGSGTGEGQFNQPAGITIDDDANIIVTDRRNGRIQVF